MAPGGPLVFAGKSVAASVIKEIITKAFRYLDGYFSAETMEEMETKLKSGLMQIQAVLDVVSPDHIESEKIEPLDQWFWKLRDAVEEAEDAVDELEYYELEEKAKDHQVSEWGSPFAKAKHKVITSVKHVNVLDKTVKRFTHRVTLKRLKKAVNGLEKAVAGATKFLEVVKYFKGGASSRSGQEDFMSNDRQTGSTSTVTKFVGREKEKMQILEWLSKKTTAEEEAEIVPIFSLIGHGGMGKTTLAQQICKHGEVVRDFKVIWVTVSTSFDATSVTKKILESVIRETPKADSLEPLQQALKDKLKCADKFFLVLDDVWEEEKRNEWEKLFAPLRTMKEGSKILLTTRMASVAAMAASVMGIAREGLTLEELQADENLELFNHHVFSGLNSQDYGELKIIGKQIATKLKGCPLVTKVVSGHLQGNLTSQFWNRFLCEGYLNDFKGNTDDIMKVLRLSYYYLPTELQTCFRYCSIFPQDYKFTKKELSLMWIGSGLIPIRENDAKSLEEIAEDYVFQLSRKSFFEKKINEDKSSYREEEYYVMHDLMHELAEYVSSGECKRILSPAQLEGVKDTVRHLRIENINEPCADHFIKFQHFQNLRTLIISNFKGETIRKDRTYGTSIALENLRSLRLIQMYSDCPFNFPRKSCTLKHLRAVFVDILAPESRHVISKFYHLMVLQLDGALINNRRQGITKKVRNVGSLDRLRYLSYEGFNQLPVSRLTSLQELNLYKLQGSKGNKISDIRNLKYLRELGVWNLQYIDDSDEARNAKLEEKKYLMSLSFGWSASSSDTQNRIDHLVLDQLEPHANIRKLCMVGYEGLRPPLWMDHDNLTVKNLVSLELKGCINWEHLSFLGELVLLRHLTLQGLPKLQQIGGSSHLSSSGSMELYFPPDLCSLIVKKCQELRELPILPTSLVYLELRHVGLTHLPRIGNLHSENIESQQSCQIKIIVQNCPGLISLEGSLLEHKQYMGGVLYLAIENCICLESVFLPFEQMSKLETLRILKCPKMRMLGGGGDVILPSSLQNLYIGQCGDLEHTLLGSLQRPTNLFYLSLEHCSGWVSLPSADICCKNLKLLRELKIIGCDNLTSLGWLRSLPSLSSLSLTECCKLVAVARSCMTGHASAGEEEDLVVPQLNYLEIDLPSLLLIEPLKSLCHTRDVCIEDFRVASETESLPEQWLLQNCASLRRLTVSKAESLPQSMRSLSSLKILEVHYAKKIQSLPDLPSSLQALYVWHCHPDLERKITGYKSPEWDKISHVQRVEIGNCLFILGKKCNRKIYDKLRGADDNTLACWANQRDNGKGVRSALTRWGNLCRLGGAS